MPPAQSTPASPSTRLALATLFGDRFLERAEPELVSSFEDSRDLWADLLISLWTLRLGEASTRERAAPAPAPAAPPPGAQLPPELTSQVPALAQFAPPPPDPFEVPAARVSERPPEPPAAAPGGNGSTPAAASPAAAEPTGDGTAALEVFDPAVDELSARYAARPRTPEEVRAFLVDLLVEKTGYPPETFEDDLDLEVDLGIDTVKQVEVMAAVRQAFQLTVDENFRMRDYTTLRAATDYIVKRLQADASGAAAPSDGAGEPQDEAAAPAPAAAAENDEQFTTL